MSDVATESPFGLKATPIRFWPDVPGRRSRSLPVGAGGGELAAVRSEGDVTEVAVVEGLQRRDELAGGHVPEIDDAPAGAGGRVRDRQQASVRAERDVVQAMAVRVMEGVDDLAGGHVPQVRAAVGVTRGDEAAVRAERDAVDALAPRVVQAGRRSGTDM